MLGKTELDALCDLRRGFEEATPAEQWPAAAAGELCLLADVVYSLGGGDEEARAVIGEPGYVFLADLTGAPVGCAL